MSRSSALPSGDGLPSFGSPYAPKPRDVRVSDELADLSDLAWSSLDQLGRALRVPDGDLDSTLVAVLDMAIGMVEGCEAAGLNLFEKGRFVPQVVRGAAPPRLDALQQETGEGPCVDASRDQVTVDIDDMTTESRWPEFTRLAIELSVGSMLCLPLWINDRRLGSLSLYGSTPQAFTAPAAHQTAQLLSTHAALALADVQRSEQLRRAVANRDLIGQAKGILMERHRITADAAFEMLVEISQRVNRKVVAIAEMIATTGQVPS
ncbi:GAF and ANTAR domain-containing protein [Mycolicibacterium chubuense]|uniref:GAF and ANTAR domain-containing protein n=1 Tax=Mycolicibacterium chubuense TaxID=1800 RepID=UPI001300D550|nr:GAF and ANTAR domain-containing protein [Mycolicibacterium chubuense]